MDHRFAELKPGTYQLAWVASNKDRFQSGKTAKDTIEFTVVDMSEPLKIGVPVGEGRTMADPSALIGALEEAATLKQKDYTAESWQLLQTAIKAAEVIRDDVNQTQEALDLAYENVRNAITALVTVVEKPDLPKDPTENEDPSKDRAETEQETETIAPGDDGEATEEEPAASGIKQLLGCGSAIGTASVGLWFALIPLALKKKKSN